MSRAGLNDAREERNGDREAADMARIAWYGEAHEQPPFVNPYPPTPEQVERTIRTALDAWFR